jgi:hypothetical protein
MDSSQNVGFITDAFVAKFIDRGPDYFLNRGRGNVSLQCIIRVVRDILPITCFKLVGGEKTLRRYLPTAGRVECVWVQYFLPLCVTVHITWHM